MTAPESMTPAQELGALRKELIAEGFNPATADEIAREAACQQFRDAGGYSVKRPGE